MPFLPGVGFHRRQPLQYAASIYRLLVLAASAQFTELLPEMSQFCDSYIDVCDVLIQQLVDAAAIRRGSLHQGEKRTDFVVGHVQSPTITQKTQSLDVSRPVATVIGGRARRSVQQSLPLVIAHGLHCAPRRLCEFTDFHEQPPVCLTL